MVQKEQELTFSEVRKITVVEDAHDPEKEERGSAFPIPSRGITA
jgi:hypothetical protein